MSQRVRIHPHRDKVLRGEDACISVKPMGKRNRENPLYYAGTVILRDVTFPIHQSGVARARREGQRNVHAWADGQVIQTYPGPVPITRKLLMTGMRKVTYHFEEGYFQDFVTGEPVTETDYLYAAGRDFYYLPKDK